MKIHIFNPENDMALANGTPGYTPPANIRTYRQANWRLPEKWASPEDIIWDGETHFDNLGIPAGQDFEIFPWGWSPAIVHQLRLAGFPPEKMPSRQWLQKLRTLSSRQTTVSIQRQLGLEAYVCHTTNEITDITHHKPQRNYILKSPWSSSGKGLMTTENANWTGWVRNILKQQGAVIVERKLDRAQDFAMEFMIDRKHNIKYLGLSMFATDEYGHYLRNIQNPQIPASLKEQVLKPTLDWYLTNLPRIAPWYHGPVGVDMLITATGKICPCIEINWRMTMGMVTLLQQVPHIFPDFSLPFQ